MKTLVLYGVLIPSMCALAAGLLTWQWEGAFSKWFVSAIAGFVVIHSTNFVEAMDEDWKK